MHDFKFITTDNLISQLGLQKHPEGGYFAETDRQTIEIPSPFADESLYPSDGSSPRSLATSIYYLLTKDSPSGVIHMNKSVTYHLLHQGRAEYTLINPEDPSRVEKKIMGTNAESGESRLLLVGTGIWKMSRLLTEDLENEEKAKMGCLISEVVVPGFFWEDHQFLTIEKLRELFKGVDDGENMIAELSAHVKGM